MTCWSPNKLLRIVRRNLAHGTTGICQTIQTIPDHTAVMLSSQTTGVAEYNILLHFICLNFHICHINHSVKQHTLTHTRTYARIKQQGRRLNSLILLFYIN